MKYAEIKGLTDTEIADRIKEEKINLVKMRFSHSIAAIENPSLMSKTRKLVAKLNTELTSRRNSQNA